MELPGEWVAGVGTLALSVASVTGAVIRHLYTELREARALLVSRTDAHTLALARTQNVTLEKVEETAARDVASRAAFTSAIEDQGDAVRDVGALLKDLVELTQRVHDVVTAIDAEVHRKRGKG